ncbi:MAG TPA: hypothetical protein VLX92_01360 [Kofleriaceae bacterium]|nr:hypothetical protein [Kofleriaceae bacterium]
MRLAPHELLACAARPMQRLREVPRDEIEVWPYVEAQRDVALAGHDVACVYRTADGRYDHVLIPTARAGEVVVVVVDLAANQVIGHEVMFQNALYVT